MNLPPAASSSCRGVICASIIPCRVRRCCCCRTATDETGCAVLQLRTFAAIERSQPAPRAELVTKHDHDVAGRVCDDLSCGIDLACFDTCFLRGECIVPGPASASTIASSVPGLIWRKFAACSRKRIGTELTSTNLHRHCSLLVELPCPSVAAIRSGRHRSERSFSRNECRDELRSARRDY